MRERARIMFVRPVGGLIRKTPPLHPTNWMRVIGALALSIGTLHFGAAPNLAPVVHGEDLEEHTERLIMIVDTISYRYLEEGALESCYGVVDRGKPASGGLVGFSQTVWDDGDCLERKAFELRASADIASLKDKGAKLIQAARLSYDEAVWFRGGRWTIGDTCVGQVHGLFGVDMVDGQARTRVYESGASHTGATEWNVTGLVNSWFIGSAENNGLLLVGHLAPGEYGDDPGACTSHVSNLHLEVAFMRESPRLESDMLPTDLVRANTPTPTRTPGPIEREKQDVDEDVLIYRSPTPTHMLPGGMQAESPPQGQVSKPGGSSDLVRAVTSTPTRTPEPMVVPRPRGPFVQ